MKSRLYLSFAVPSVLAATLLGCGGPARGSSPTEAAGVATTGEGDGAVTKSGVEKVTICHIPPGNPGNPQTITVGAPAVPAHLAEHGDSIGSCPEPSPSPSPEPTPTPTLGA
jgi:hypothetical protein